jgi:hypothetical protein
VVLLAHLLSKNLDANLACDVCRLDCVVEILFHSVISVSMNLMVVFFINLIFTDRFRVNMAILVARGLCRIWDQQNGLRFLKAY